MERPVSANIDGHAMDIEGDDSSSTADDVNLHQPYSHNVGRLSTARHVPDSQLLSSLPTASNSRRASFTRTGDNIGRRHRSPLNSGFWISVELFVNLSQITAAIIVLFLSRHEHPHAPLFAWIIGYAAGCVATLPHLLWRYVHCNGDATEQASTNSLQNLPQISAPESVPYSAISVARSLQRDNGEGTGGALQLGQNSLNTARRLNMNAFVDHFKMALDFFFAVWFVVGNVWIFGGHSSASVAPNLYRLCLVFLTFSCIGYAMPFILCVIICCCLPCIISVMGLREDMVQTRGATTESISSLPTYKFKVKKTHNSEGEGEVMAAGSDTERGIYTEDAHTGLSRTFMASRGYLSSSLHGKPAQAPGMLRHGPFPGYPSSGQHTLDHVNRVEILEKKIADQEDEMDRLSVENRRLASTHMVLRQELVSSQHELQQIHAHVGSMHNEAEIEIRSLLEKITKAEADIYASEEVKKELQSAHLEGQSLLTERQELTTEIQHMTEALQKAKADVKNLPEMRLELEGLRQEHKKLRLAFEYEKNLNKEQVDHMRGMEKNLLTMSNEVEILRAEILKIEKTAQVPNQYGGSYGTPAPVYPSAAQAFTRHPDQGYSQGVTGYAENAIVASNIYPNSAYGNAGHAGYAQGYGMASTQMAGGVSVQGGNLYSNVSAYPNGSIMPMVPVAGGVQARDGMNTAASATAGSYDRASAGGAPLPPGLQQPSVPWR